jgi:hypothetical protein
MLERISTASAQPSGPVLARGASSLQEIVGQRITSAR